VAQGKHHIDRREVRPAKGAVRMFELRVDDDERVQSCVLGNGGIAAVALFGCADIGAAQLQQQNNQ